MVEGQAALLGGDIHTPNKNIMVVSRDHRLLKSALFSLSVRFYCNG